MHQDIALIATFSTGFVFAALFGYGADRLHLPPLVGYLFAGVLMGPYTPGYIADSDLAQQLAEMGIILLMFGVGLHFSASDLMAVRRLAVPGAVAQIVLATGLGALLAALWGWPLGAGLVLGLSLSVASTVVVLKALEERNLINTPHGRVAIGWLITEDLAMVVALVLLPAFAGVLGGTVDDHAAPAASAMAVALTVVTTLAKVGAFAAMAIVLGPRIVPWLLTMVARTGSRELFTLSVLAIALGIAFGSAEIFGVSFAIGAFFAGVIMSESHLSHRAAADSLPLQNAFSVLFFVSVGMLFDPSILVREPAAVLEVLAVIILGKAVIAVLLVAAMRYPFRLGLSVAASLAQIGEFTFILAGLAVGLGILPVEGRDLLLAGAILSITFNPLVMTGAEALQKYVRRRWPGAARYGRARYDALGQELTRISELRSAKEHEHQARLEQLLQTFPLFSEVDSEDQEELLLLFRPRPGSPGERVIRQGDRGDAMFFIASGAVEVRLDTQAIRLESGAFFGEMALLTGERRTADVIAVDFCQFLVLERRDFNLFMSRHPKLRAAVSSKAKERREMNVSRRRRDEPSAG